MTAIFRCDGCGKELRKGQLRYDVSIEVKAAYDTMEVTLADLVKDHREELRKLVNEMEEKDARDVEESVYKGFKLHLCPSCQRAYLRDPVRFHPEQSGDAPAVDIDTFLRSLGFGEKKEPEQD